MIRRTSLAILALLAVVVLTTVDVSAAPRQQSLATLSSLTLSGVTLEPTFDPATTSYTATVPYNVTETTITATPTTGVINLIILGSITYVSGDILPLAYGQNAITVFVQDGSTSTAYFVTVTRPQPRALRTISPSTVAPGEVFDVTLTFDSTKTALTAVDEHLPDGFTWVLADYGALINSEISPDNDQVLELTLLGGVAGVTYQLTASTVPGDYEITGIMLIEPMVTTPVVGDTKITVALPLPPGVTVSPTMLTVPEGSTATYTIVLDTQPTSGVTVTIVDPTDNTDVTADPASLSFSTSNWSTPQTVTVRASEDADSAQDTATVTHTVSGGDYGSVTASDVAVTVTDNDTAGVTVSPTSLTVTEEDPTGASYTVVLDSQPTADVEVTVVVPSGTEVTPSPTSLTFTTSDWDTSQTVTVTAGDDADTTTDTVTLTHGAASADSDYQGIMIANVEVTVNDIDTTAGICGRTEEVRDALVALIPGVSDCAAVTDADLAAITGSLDVSNQSISDLKAGDFNGLTQLQLLYLFDNQLTTLPVGVFAGLTQLRTLFLDNSGLTTLPVGVLAGLTRLEILWLNHNKLTTLPGGVFDGLTQLRRLYLNNNQLNTLPDDVFAGLTSLIELDLNNNELNTLPVGVFAGLTALTQLQLNDNKLETLPVEVFAGLDTLTILGLYNNELTTLPVGVFAGLTQLKLLYLYNNQLNTLPVGVFDWQDTLTTLWLYNNGLTTLPDDVFAGLDTLQTLRLEDNELNTLPDDVFAGLTQLKTLFLYDNELTTLPVGVFDGLTRLDILFLYDNELTTLPVGVFDGLTQLRTLWLEDNGLTTLPVGVFAGLTKLETLFLYNNGLTTLPVGVFDGLTALETLWLEDNDLATLPEGVFELLTALTDLRLSGNSVAPVAPTADALPDDGTVSTFGGTVTLDGSGSDGGPWGTNVTYAWALTTPASGATFDNDTSSTPEVTIQTLAAGTKLTFTLTVTGRGHKDTTFGTDTNTDTATVTATTPGVTVSPTMLTVPEGDTRTYTVALNTQPTGSVTVGISSNNTDVTVSSSSLTFTTGNWSTAQTITVTAAQDGDAANDTAVLTHVPSGADYNSVSDVTLTVTVTDDETAGVTVSPTTLTVPEGDTRTYTVALNTQPTGSVTVGITSNNTDVTVSSSSLTFTTGNWSTAQTITVTAAQDGDAANDTAVLTHVPSGADYNSVSNVTLTVTVTDDETAGITVSPTSLPVNEGSTATYTIVLDTQPTSGVTVTINDPTDNTDVTADPASLSFSTSNWSTPQTVTVRASEDADSAQDTATVTHTVSGGDYASVTASDVAVTVTDNDTAGITVSPTMLTVPEGSTRTYTVALNTQPTGSVTVGITSNNTDVTVSSSSLTFTTGNWNTAQTITVTAAQDGDAANDMAVLTHVPSGADYNSVSDVTLTVTVTDDETAGITVSPTSLPVNEGSTATYTIVLDTQPTSGVTVTINDPTDNTDVTADPASLSFSTSNWSTPQTVTVRASEDADSAQDTATVTHTVSGGDYASVTASDVAVTVPDNDTAGITVSPTMLTVPEGDTRTYTVALNTQPTGSVTVGITSNNTDVTVSSSSLTFTTGNWSTAQTITVTAAQDGDAANDTAVLTHVPSGADYNSVSNVTLTVTVTDDETAGITVSPTSLPVNEGSTATYTIVLDTQPTSGVTVTINDPTDNTDVTADPASLSFSTSNWSTPQTVTVRASEDADSAQDTATVTHTVSGGDYASVTASDVAVTVTDNDTAGITVSPTMLTVPEGDTRTYTVALNTQPTGSVTVGITSNNTDVTVSSSSLTFTTGNWSTAQTITVTAAQDGDAANDTAVLTHDPSGADYNSVSDVTLTVTVTDDETAGITVSPTSLPVNEGSTATYTVVLDTQPTSGVTVTINDPTDNTDVTADPASLSFSTSNWSTPQTVTVRASEDADSAQDTATVTHTVSGGDYASVTASDVAVTVPDNDTAGITVSPTMLTVPEGDTRTYTVALNTQPTGSVTVGISSNNTDVTVSSSSLTFTTGNWSTAQTITVTAAQDGDAANDTAVLTHVPSGADYNSVSNVTLTVTVTDDETAGITVSPTSLPVNEGSTATYTIVLDTQPTSGVTVTINDPTDNTDVTADPASLSFSTSNWSTPQTVTVRASEDADSAQDTATVTHTVSGGDYASVTASDVAVTVTDNDTAGITVSPTMLTVPEGDTRTYTVALNTQPTGSVTVGITSNNTDVTVSSSSLTFTTGNWSTAQTITVTAAQDGDAANDMAVLTHVPSGADYNSVSDVTLTVTVTDDETAGITVSPTSLPVNEGSTATYTIVLDTQPTSGVTVTINDPTDNTDVTADPASLSFSTSNWSTPQTVTVRASEDADSAQDTATVTHTVSGGDYASVTASDVAVTVPDNDTAGITVSPTMLTVPEGDTRTYTVALNTQPTGSVTVGITSNNTDVTVSSSSLTFTTGNWSTAQTITVTAAQDGDAANDTAVLTHVPSGADYNSVSNVTLTVTVTDDETAGITVSPTSLPVNEGSTATYTIVLDTQPTSGVTVTINDPTDNTDVTADPASLSFSTSNWSTPQTVTVRASEDADSAQDTATVTHTVSGGDYASVTASDVAVTVPDNDTAGVTVSPTTLTVTEEGTTGETYTVVLDSQPTASVEITVAGHSGTDVTPTPDSLTFTTSDWDTSQAVTVTAGDDADTTTDTVTLTHSAASADSDYQGIMIANVEVTVNDNDTAPGICGRTPEVRDALLDLIPGVSDCAAVTAAQLAAITGSLDVYDLSIDELAAGDFAGLTALRELYLYHNELTELPAGVFAGLSSLDTLYLDNNGLTSLPAGVFDGLTSLEALFLFNNELTELPEDVFAGLTMLEILLLNSNDLAALPDDVFEPLTSLKVLYLADNREAPFAPTADARPDDGTVPVEGGTVRLDGSGSGGPWGTNVSYHWELTPPARGVTFNDATSATPVVTIPELEAGTELTFTLTVTGRGGTNSGIATATDTAKVTATDSVIASGDATLGGLTVNDGTRELTLAPAFASGTTDYTASVGNAVTTVTLTATVNHAGASVSAVTLNGTAIADNDFTDGIRVPSLLVGGNGIIVTVRAENGATQTYTVTVTVTRTTTTTDTPGVSVAPAALTVTEQNTTGDNYTVVLDSQPTASVEITVAGHSGTDVTPNPDSLTFTTSNWDTAQTVTVTAGDDTDTTTDTVTLTHSAASADSDYDGIMIANVEVTVNDNDDDTPAVSICGRTPEVRDALLDLIPGVSDCAAVTAADLAAITGPLNLSDQNIAGLAAGDFAGLTRLEVLSLSNNGLTSLPGGVFDGLTSVEVLFLSNNGLTSLSSGDFDGLTSVEVLALDNNGLDELPAGVFAGPTMLNLLTLHNNELTSLPAGVFDELTRLKTLYLFNNELVELRAGVFDELTRLKTLYLYGNALEELPDGVFQPLTSLSVLKLRGNPGAPFAPTADARPDDGTVPVEGGTVTLDGSGSDGGPWGTNVSYSWELTTPVSGVTFDDDTSATPEVTIPELEAGTKLTFTLTVTGRGGTEGIATATDTAKVTATASTASGEATASTASGEATRESLKARVPSSRGPAMRTSIEH